jgi:hypothetical protein
MKDWGLWSLSRLVWRARLDLKRAALDPDSPSEEGHRSNPSCTGKAGLCVTTGQKLRKVPVTFYSNGVCGPYSAIVLLEQGLTFLLNPPPPSPRVLAADWVLVRKVSDGVEDEGLGAFGD